MSEPFTVESALKELGEMFPRHWSYVTVQQTGDCSPDGKCKADTFVIVQVDSERGDIVYHGDADSLSEAMAQVHAFKQSQDNKKEGSST